MPSAISCRWMPRTAPRRRIPDPRSAPAEHRASTRTESAGWMGDRLSARSRTAPMSASAISSTGAPAGSLGTVPWRARAVAERSEPGRLSRSRRPTSACSAAAAMSDRKCPRLRRLASMWRRSRRARRSGRAGCRLCRRRSGPVEQLAFEQALGDDGALRRPPAVDRLLADAGGGGDPLDREVVVTPLDQQRGGRLKDRLARACSATCRCGGVSSAAPPMKTRRSVLS